ncbi:helix-turn-helix transcriptional regulator [Dongia rigui]|uniref:Helix-turn-helix transcriptional regulator n=1 Tax=Dongia rigui TaxID=940149 RepID=A0ABU5DYD5_9PROT|nr:helix-turn-helix transcriptional regulator [Dongia rigui]MDY0872017.1 helix-turn-helix transcriptional regulator [Dongia rigui]
MALEFQSIDTRNLPEGHRLNHLHDFLARELMGIDISPRTNEVGFTVTVNALVLPGIRIVEGISDPLTCARSKAMLADGQNDFILDVMSAPVQLTLENRWQVEVRAGDGLLYPLDRPWRMVHDRADVRCLRLARALLAAHIPDLDSVPLRVLRPEDGLLGLLMGYAELVYKGGTAQDPVLAAAMSRHLVELAVHAFGKDAARPLAPETRQTVAAMRLDLFKADIERSLADHGFDIARLARRHKVTPRYIQMLFADSGTTFTDFLRQQRLALAYRLLVDPAQATRNVADLAFAAGFNDLSHFNRVFRRRFGATPREIRTTC